MPPKAKPVNSNVSIPFCAARMKCVLVASNRGPESIRTRFLESLPSDHLKRSPIMAMAQRTPRHFALSITGRPDLIQRARRTVHKKFEYPQTRSPTLKTSPWPSAKFWAYLKEMNASSNTAKKPTTHRKKKRLLTTRKSRICWKPVKPGFPATKFFWRRLPFMQSIPRDRWKKPPLDESGITLKKYANRYSWFVVSRRKSPAGLAHNDAETLHFSHILRSVSRFGFIDIQRVDIP